MSSEIDIGSPLIEVAIVLKLQQLQREQLNSLTYQHIEDTLSKWLWKFKRPTCLSEAVNDILSISANEVVLFLTNQAIIEAKEKSVSEFCELWGGSMNE